MGSETMACRVELEQETDGRWLAEVPDLPGVLAYGATPTEAQLRAELLARVVMEERGDAADRGSETARG